MFAAGLHLCAAAPAAFIIEYSLGLIPCYLNSPEAPKCTGGYVEISDRPGLKLLLAKTLWACSVYDGLFLNILMLS